MADAPEASGSLLASDGQTRKGPLDVSVAVFQRADGAVLLARRPASKVYAGFWEFPGGKVEAGETLEQALAREVEEELGSRVERSHSWITQVFSYPHATVRLHFFRVTAWSGEPRAREHDGLTWQQPGAIDVAPLLPANGPVLRGLLLPVEYAISNARGLGVREFLARLERRLDQGLRLVQVREPGWSREQLADLTTQVIHRARPRGALVLVNNDTAVAHRTGADGVHVTSVQLRTLTDRPDLPWVGASCHDAGELDAAQRLGADFAVLGPVAATPTHPDSVPMGWEGFQRLARGRAMPVYALGGMCRDDLEVAMRHGAHGIAMVRGAWA